MASRFSSTSCCCTSWGSRGGTGRAGELAERLQAHHHGVVALVDRCEELRLLQRRPGREDQRIVEIHLLPKGKQLLAQLAALHKEERRALLRELLRSMHQPHRWRDPADRAPRRLRGYNESQEARLPDRKWLGPASSTCIGADWSTGAAGAPVAADIAFTATAHRLRKAPGT